jgi:hypothetical protein
MYNASIRDAALQAARTFKERVPDEEADQAREDFARPVASSRRAAPDGALGDVMKDLLATQHTARGGV